MRDLNSNIDVVASLAPATRTNGTANGAAADLQGFNSAVLVFQSGALTDGTHTPSVEASDDNVTFTAVPAAELSGALAALSANSVQRVGYIGSKRYLRPVITTAGATSGGLSAAAVVRGHPAIAPTA